MAEDAIEGPRLGSVVPSRPVPLFCCIPTSSYPVHFQFDFYCIPLLSLQRFDTIFDLRMFLPFTFSGFVRWLSSEVTCLSLLHVSYHIRMTHFCVQISFIPQEAVSDIALSPKEKTQTEHFLELGRWENI